jgi:hypothetical protein
MKPDNRKQHQATLQVIEDNWRAVKESARVYRELGPQTALDVMMKRERWHVRGGSWIADSIYGVNDGLGAVFGIVSGVAGAPAIFSPARSCPPKSWLSLG